MKTIEFCGNTLKIIRHLPIKARNEVGFQLDRVQRGLLPFDWKPMPTIGKGVREIRVHENGQFRVIYLVVRGNKVFVLHAFRKKTQKTGKQEISLARSALKELLYRKKL
jgi:phage-related protein